MESDPLRSARAKLRRANLHKSVAIREARRFFDRHPDVTGCIEPERDERTTRIGAVQHCQLVVRSAPPEPPDSFAARFGEAMYNYRCALDHLAWQLVAHGVRWPLDDQRAARVQFPIYTAAEAFDGNVSSRLPGVDRVAIDFIKARHRYKRGKATNDALLGIAKLSNDDKHRQLHLFLARLRAMQSEVALSDCRLVSWETPARGPALKEGAVLARFSYLVTEANPKVQMHLRPQAQIVIEDGRDFSEMLQALAREVDEILNAPEILAAVADHATPPTG